VKLSIVIPTVVALGALATAGVLTAADHSKHDPSMHAKHSGMMKKAVEDKRELVLYPRPVYESTLRNMREHLRGISEVQRLVGEGHYAEAAEAAERGMGMGHNHGAEGNAGEHQFMPQGMMALGSGMHMAAADLAMTLRDAEVTDDLQAVFVAMGKVTANCVACHDAYRLQPME
jgi:hypothetical protein